MGASVTPLAASLHSREICHCRNCQRYTGSAFEPVMAFPRANVSLQGELKTYEDKGAPAKLFCAACVRTADRESWRKRRRCRVLR